MVQSEPNLTLTLKHLATCGAVVSAEQQAALDHSLVIKKVEAGLKSLTLWGKITTLNGKDYLIAEGSTKATFNPDKGIVEVTSKYYYSQDGAKFIDLLPVSSEEAAQHGLRYQYVLSGDPASVCTVKDHMPPPGAPPPEEDEEDPKGVKVPELEVLRARVDAIAAATSLAPTGAMVTDALNSVVPNKLFGGAPYPDKLEAYSHRTSPPGGPTLASDLRGTWAVQHDPFRQVAICRSLLWPGYCFFYNGAELTWGGLYMGTGIRNNDLIWML